MFNEYKSSSFDNLSIGSITFLLPVTCTNRDVAVGLIGRSINAISSLLSYSSSSGCLVQLIYQTQGCIDLDSHHNLLLNLG